LHQRLAVCSRQDLGRLDGGINTVWTATAFIRGIDCIAEFRTQSDSAILNSYSDRAVPPPWAAAVTAGGRRFNILAIRERSRNVKELLELD
jgi:hypothetical protein